MSKPIDPTVTAEIVCPWCGFEYPQPPWVGGDPEHSNCTVCNNWFEYRKSDQGHVSYKISRDVALKRIGMRIGR